MVKIFIEFDLVILNKLVDFTTLDLKKSYKIIKK